MSCFLIPGPVLLWLLVLMNSIFEVHIWRQRGHIYLVPDPKRTVSHCLGVHRPHLWPVGKGKTEDVGVCVTVVGNEGDNEHLTCTSCRSLSPSLLPSIPGRDEEVTNTLNPLSDFDRFFVKGGNIYPLLFILSYR